jgi:hypothetical protein
MMPPPILIIEPHPELAAAFAAVVSSASYTPQVRPHVQSLTDLGVRPAVIVIRIGHGTLPLLGPDRPPIVAIAATEADAAEAERLGCDVVLHGAVEICKFLSALERLVRA